MPLDNHSLNRKRSAAAKPIEHGRSSRPFLWLCTTKTKMAKSLAAARWITTEWLVHAKQQRRRRHTVSWLAIAVLMILPVTSTTNTTDLLPAARAVVGQKFVHKISDAIPLAERLQVAGADSTRLPKWLHYNHLDQTLTGIPRDGDTGVYVISVRSRDGGNGSIDARFAITVIASDATSSARRYRRQVIKATATSLQDRVPPTSAGDVRASVAAAFWKGEDGEEHPCSRAKTAYHKLACPCERHRDAVFFCSPMTIDGCRNQSEAEKECQRRGSAYVSSAGVMPRGGENGTTPSVISTSMQPNENAPMVFSDVGSALVTHAAGAPTDSSAPSAAYIVAIATVVVLYALVCLCAAVWIRYKLRNAARLDYSAVRTA